MASATWKRCEAGVLLTNHSMPGIAPSVILVPMSGARTGGTHVYQQKSCVCTAV